MSDKPAQPLYLKEEGLSAVDVGPPVKLSMVVVNSAETSRCSPWAVLLLNPLIL